ncbi:MAG: 30S ribosomal protein S20 [Candidatus Lambdaproteobacteria bacterium RIFOXYD1_FULL_56_27]|uniref:Small ribosomal subunit protein bS20 n=1 Tax=Candidatus Lambdaproteobacteria bacterium RIFOXYD2_FULL_56_26 TaxID=1817773 RepID=A0A1F6H3T0_9PROT|nr:MAG: 30S ribosomal protein S20 [Candidatus Lambdaproteobacteria bacterium RIFOXYC1_FULL_56_13]OGH05022.1 MAG: 30S ribosomal protein S20 [Candidatus Lambdaproteobacteria bacterium RIFOXYD2_FULL_56_26]OGH09487.1 MAG: 30S ribosomal protein S20 [Candidatus Lambdaproteobacteria bacterium RIFOXYD1_FULL_56_27]
MANHKSAIKRALQSEKNRQRNRVVRGSLRTEIKKFNALLEGGEKDKALALLPTVHKLIDKAATKGVVTKSTASRKKSRTTLALNKALV